MTQLPLEALPWPGAASRDRAAPLPRALWFGLGVFVVLVFSQGWVMLVTGPDVDPESSGAVRALYFPAYLAAAALAWSGRERLASLSWRGPLIWPPLLMILLSAHWSIDPSTTERRLVALGFTVLGGLALAARFEWEELVEVLATAFGLLALASAGLGVAKPTLGRMTSIFPGAWRGLWYEKNALGDIMTTGTLVFAAAAVMRPARRMLWLGGAALALALIVLSTSKTSLVTLMASLGVMALVALARRGGAWTVLAAFLAASGAALVAGLALFASDKLFLLLGKDATLTGRTKVWQGALLEANQRPWTGFGYGVVWGDKDPWGPRAWIYKVAGFEAQHAHNGWIETYLGEGRFGVLAVAAWMIDLWVRAIASISRSAGAWFAVPFMAIYSLTMLTESTMLIYNDLYTVLLTAVAGALALPRRAAAAP